MGLIGRERVKAIRRMMGDSERVYYPGGGPWVTHGEICETLDKLWDVAEAAQETRDAATYLMQLIAMHMDPKFIRVLDHKYDGFGKRIDEALAALSEGEGGGK